MTKSSDNQVLVIGAGLAGLSTARSLHLQGVDTIVLEARDRIGGRVNSHILPNGVTVDLGAQFIGPRQHRVNALAVESGAATEKLHVKGHRVREPETSLSLRDRINIARLAWRLNSEARRTPAAAPWQRNHADELDAISTAQWLDSLGSPAAAAVWKKLAHGSFCIDPQRFSALEALQHFSSMGGLLGLATAETGYFKNGAATLTDYLAQTLTIETSCPVKSIEQQDKLVCVTTNSHTYKAQHVVVAVPPQIGYKLLNSKAATTIGYMDSVIKGDVTKTALVYSSAWWKNKRLSGMASSDVGPVNELISCTPKDANYGCLIAFSHGTTFQSQPADSDMRTQHIIDHVNKLLGSKLHQPLQAISVDWTQEVYSRGGFSSVRTPNSWIRHGQGQFSNDGPIHFAGTEFAHEWRSYMEGALESAERATSQVIDALK